MLTWHCTEETKVAEQHTRCGLDRNEMAVKWNSLELMPDTCYPSGNTIEEGDTISLRDCPWQFLLLKTAVWSSWRELRNWHHQVRVWAAAVASCERTLVCGARWSCHDNECSTWTRPAAVQRNFPGVQHRHGGGTWGGQVRSVRCLPASISLSHLCLSVCLSVFVCLRLCLPSSLSPSLSTSVFACLRLCPLPVSVFVYLHLCLSPSLSTFVFACLRLCLLSVSVFVCLRLCLSPSLFTFVFACLCLCLSPSLSAFVFACLCLCHRLCLPSSLPVTVFVCLRRHLSPSPPV